MPPRDENRETILRDIENLRAVLSDGTDIPLPEVARIHAMEEDAEPLWYDELIIDENGSAVDRALRRLSEQMRVNSTPHWRTAWHDDATYIQGIQEVINQSVQESIYQHFERALSAVGDIVADTANSAASVSSAIATWMDALNDAWINIGEDFEIDEESEYQATDPLSFDELMNFGGSK